MLQHVERRRRGEDEKNREEEKHPFTGRNPLRRMPCGGHDGAGLCGKKPALRLCGELYRPLSSGRGRHVSDPPGLYLGVGERAAFPTGEDHVVFRWRGRNTEGADRSLELKEATVLLAYGKPFSSEVQYVTEEAWPVDSALNGLDIKVPLEGKDGCRAVRGVVFYTLVPTGQWDIGAAALETGYYCCKEEGDYSMQIGEDGSVIYIEGSTGEVPAEFVQTTVAYPAGGLIVSEERRPEKMGIYDLMIQPLILYVGAPFAVWALYRLLKGVMREMMEEERKKNGGSVEDESQTKTENLIWPSLLYLVIYLEVILTAIL